MDPLLEQRLAEQDKKLEEIRVTVQKTYRIFFWSMVVTLALFILPLIGLVFVIPSYLSQLNAITSMQQ